MIGVLVVLLVIVIFQNTGDTKLQILFFDVTWPLWLLLTAFAALAFLAGWFARTHTRLKARRARAYLEQLKAAPLLARLARTDVPVSTDPGTPVASSCHGAPP